MGTKHLMRAAMVAASLVTIPTLAAAQKYDAVSAGSLHASAGERRPVSAPAGAERPQPDEASSAKADGSGWFTIQVAESTSARLARAMVDELKNAGHPAYLERAASGVNAPYRVRVGHFSVRADATQSARTLEKALGWQMSVTAISAE